MKKNNFLNGETKKIIYLFFNTIIKDIKSLKWYIWIFMFIVLIYSIITTIYDINGHKFGFPNYLENNKWPTLSKVFYVFQIFTTTIGIYQLILITFAKHSAWFWGTISWVMVGISSIAFGYGGQAQTSLFFLVPFQFYAHVFWYKRSNYLSKSDLIVSEMPLWIIFTTLFFAIIFTILFYFEIPLFTYEINGYYEWFEQYNPEWSKNWSINIPRLFDALTSTFEIFGYVLVIFFFRENWILWILINILQMALFAGLGGNGVDITMLSLWSIYQINCGYGLWEWYRAKKIKWFLLPEKNLEYKDELKNT